jgi:50S ribosomal protein L16 3-hydroxylase
MIPDWLAPSERLAFLRDSFGRRPYARAGAARAAIPLLSWATFDNLLRSPLAPDVIAVAAGRLANVPVPRSARDVRALITSGVSTVIRRSERHDRGLLRLAHAFAAALSGEVHVQIYATPAGTHSYGWHYDFEDVFIAQTLGIKDYYMRDNTVARHTQLGETIDFACIRQEKSQICEARLIAGDWLYIPQRWWHFVRCIEDSLSISVGIFS